jgi:hypothetical protein
MDSNAAALVNPKSLQSEFTEDLALSLLKRPDLQPELLEKFARNGTLMKSRKVKLALIQHPKTPRHVLLPLLRHLFTFDLMRVALTPTIAADIKMAAEGNLISRLEKISMGEKLSLARRASGRVAAALLNEPEPRVIDAALQNGRLTESGLIKQLSRKRANLQLITAICGHHKWRTRTDIRIVLLRSENTPIECALELVRSLPKVIAQEIINKSDLSEIAKARLRDAIDMKAAE